MQFIIIVLFKYFWVFRQVRNRKGGIFFIVTLILASFSLFSLSLSHQFVNICNFEASSPLVLVGWDVSVHKTACVIVSAFKRVTSFFYLINKLIGLLLHFSSLIKVVSINLLFLVSQCCIIPQSSQILVVWIFSWLVLKSFFST